MMRVLLAALIFCLAATGAQAHAKHHHHYYRHYAARQDGGGNGRPSAWCGWYMRQIMGVRDPSYNLAANWAHYGRPSGGPRVGAIVVWPHHVGKIVGEAGNGRWMVLSGNDGHAVRTRPRSVAGAIAFRDGGGASDYPAANVSSSSHRIARADRPKPIRYAAAEQPTAGRMFGLEGMR